VIGLLAAWWFGRDASKPVVTTQLPAGVTVEQAPLQPAIDPQAAATAVAPAAAPAAVVAPTPAIAPAAPKPAAPAPAQPANAGAAPAPAPVVVPAPPPPVAAAPAPRARIVLHANEESWADVRDAQQNRLIYETVPAGRTVTLEGVAPLQVYIGNAGGVTIEANGQALDLTRYRRGTVARFTVEAPTVGSR
jgi:cytoskeleton protein RodZ